MQMSRPVKIAAALVFALALAACSDKDNANNANGMAGANGGYGAGGAGTPGSQQEFVVNVGDRVFFEVDSTSLTGTATATLDKQAQWLQRYGRYNIVVEGHADERGTAEYNSNLGERRAQAARDYLISRGISSNRISTVSYGKTRPVAVCNDISCWSQNRRAVTVLR